ncbi:histamine H3 receptor-like [Patiria miniata]|uniref:G-protein coupled receptors family 1 profile domain-containing protein n=1 Tax=Patiria miniata TaxID=46514 RepID=A0A913YXY4_PATMI|nr:histamine H3 receptor-like [Patiria miniata]
MNLEETGSGHVVDIHAIRQILTKSLTIMTVSTYGRSARDSSHETVVTLTQLARARAAAIGMMCNTTDPAAAGCQHLAMPSDTGLEFNPSDGPTQPSYIMDLDPLASSSPEVENLINFILWLIWALIVFGNILVLVVITRDKELLLKPANIFILNLSICDLLVGVVSMTFQNIWRLRGFWTFGEFMCKAWFIIDFTSTTQSAFAITLISFDRFMLVSTGLKYKQYITLPVTCVLIVVTWCCAFTLNAVPILMSDKIFEPWVDYATECDLAIMYRFAYHLATSMLSFVLPVILVALFNITVYNNIRQRAKRFQSTRSRTSNSSTRGSQGRSTSDYKKHRKAAITLALIVGVFLICWVPYWIQQLLFLFTLGHHSTFLASDAWAYLLWSNSAVNPVLYAVTNPRIRSGMLYILRKPLPKRFAARARQRRAMEYNLGETNMTKITRQDGD